MFFSFMALGLRRDHDFRSTVRTDAGLSLALPKAASDFFANKAASIRAQRDATPSMNLVFAFSALSMAGFLKKFIRTVTVTFLSGLFILGSSALGLFTSPAHAAGKNDVRADKSAQVVRSPAISDAWARATVPGQSVGAAYMKIDSPVNATLTGIESDVSKFAEVHTMQHQNGVMQMRKQSKLDILAGRSTDLAPGGTHLMLLGLKKPLKAGESLQLKMSFVDDAGTKTVVPVTVPIRPLGK